MIPISNPPRNALNRAVKHTVAVLVDQDREDELFAQLPLEIRKFLTEDAIANWNVEQIHQLLTGPCKGNAIVCVNLIRHLQKQFTYRDYGPTHPQAV